MNIEETIASIIEHNIIPDNHEKSDYFSVIKKLVEKRNIADNEADKNQYQQAIDKFYGLVYDEIINNTSLPASNVKFGTSGWRGILGKDIFLQSVAVVTSAILALYKTGEKNNQIKAALGDINFSQMQKKGCVIGFDNRFGGEALALAAVNVLVANGITVYYAGESTTGALSASIIQRKAAFSINLTPSHNPMEYGGFKYNAADAGPAAPILTNTITQYANDFLNGQENPFLPASLNFLTKMDKLEGIIEENALSSWQELVRNNIQKHGIEYDQLIKTLPERDDVVICVDAVHGASRDYLSSLLGNPPSSRLVTVRDFPDPTFGGIAPEPSSANMQPVMEALRQCKEPFKVGAIIDPDGDRIRFTDGEIEISMNQFGAMAYHFLHEVKGKKGMVAKTVATSNFANAVATQLGEEVFEPKVGFKEFKPVMGKALVFFEESDGISIIGHTPEKDAFIGLILAIDMVLTLNKSLGEYLKSIEDDFGYYYPDRDGIVVSQQGQELQQTLTKLEKYKQGASVAIGTETKKIKELIDIDGRKMIFEDGSWIMVRASGTEPKIRFYVEARNREETKLLVKSANSMLAEIGLLP